MSSTGLPNLADVEAMVLGQLTDQERARSVAYLDSDLRPPGKTRIGKRVVQFEHAHVVAFIDRQPGANWMHPCRYLLIDPATSEFISVDADQPPRFGVLPPTWRVVWRSRDIADWQLLRITS